MLMCCAASMALNDKFKCDSLRVEVEVWVGGER